ncbi:hypothetical protein KSP35_09905 [Aquihabitans sp. G128]|uniref:hypothetical protein n=1 Tax=Aquihabitans sp. G128 TaxID=2849779 RepID=UPI001C229FF0|nr:hypothetical protein [Aquihabitans sp. G128]QXC63058.1 hypothetical protein KSP35_09905 [Aquihabitans sp. G128]
MADPVTPEAAVRRYLAWIDDPTSAVDQDAVTKAEEAFASASDPIDKLHAAAARERAKAADIDSITTQFVAQARSYAEEEGIPVEAFRSLGVSDDVLAEAGFAVPSSRGRRGPAAGGRKASSPSTPRAPQIPVSQIKAVADQMPKQFTLAQLADKAGGGSPVTVRKAVDELIAEGRAAKLGPDANHTGPGRAPTIYELR